MFAKTILVAATSLLALTTANPVELEARGSSEVVYLCTCSNGVPEGAGIQANYYKNIGNSHNGELPDSRSQWINGSPNQLVPPVEGQTRNFKFEDSGVTFTSHIDGGAKSRAVGAYAGYGSNGASFNCYRDNDQTLFSYTYGSANRRVACTKTTIAARARLI